MFDFLPSIDLIRANIAEAMAAYPEVFQIITCFIRYALCILALFIITSCAVSLLKGKVDRELWAYLCVGSERIDIGHWENTIGRARQSDIVVNLPTVSRNHAVLARDGEGNWHITDLNSKTGTFVNGNKIIGSTPVQYGNLIQVGGQELVLLPAGIKEKTENKLKRTRQSIWVSPVLILVWLSEFQIFALVQLILSTHENFSWALPFVFIIFMVFMWVWYFTFRAMRRHGFEIDLVGFFLSTLGLLVCASAYPSGLFKQFIALAIGIAIFLTLGWILRNLEFIKKLRWPAAIGTLAMLTLTLLLGEERYGAKNWINLGGITLQLSEFAKVLFVFSGAASLERLYTRRNLIGFVALAGACVIALALQGDYGTALIFFVTFIVIAFLRSGDLASVVFICSGAALGAFLVIKAKPYIANRFAAWRHVWEFAQSSGYQQTRTMSAAASGGLFGLGAGEGWLQNIGAASTDLVFGILCEELGLIVALCAVAAVAILAVFAVKSSSIGRSSYYVIVACAAASMLVFQMMLNVFGSVDILPLTGVTFPFVSTGGSSMIACWGLLAFIKANDTRQNASFVVKLDRAKEADSYEQG